MRPSDPAAPRPRRFTALRTALGAALMLTLAAGTVAVSTPQAQAATNQFKGVNWADTRDNFVNGVLYVSGLSSTDTYSSANTVGNQVVGQLYTITGGNTVRMPINEPTVASYWSTYTGAIDAALSKGNVILAYWAYANGKPASTTTFNQMWDTVVAKYGSNTNAYFEVINEPYGYSNTDLDNFYNTWLTRYPSVPRSRVILDGAGLAQNVSAVGSDNRLNNTLLAAHDYSFFAGYKDETSGPTTSPATSAPTRAVPSSPSGAARWAPAARTVSTTTRSTTASRADRSSPTTSAASAANCAPSGWAACTGRGCATATGTA